MLGQQNYHTDSMPTALTASTLWDRSLIIIIIIILILYRLNTVDFILYLFVSFSFAPFCIKKVMLLNVCHFYNTLGIVHYRGRLALALSESLTHASECSQARAGCNPRPLFEWETPTS